MSPITDISRRKQIYKLLLRAVFGTLLIILSLDLLDVRPGEPMGFIVIFSILAGGAFLQLSSIAKEHKKRMTIVSDILNSFCDIVVIKNYEGKFVFCNEAAARLYDSSPQDMVGKDDFHFTKDREQSDFLRTSAQQVMNEFRRQEILEELTDAKTGEMRYHKSIKIPYRDAVGERKILIVAKDVSDIVALKEEADRNKMRLQHVLDVSQEGLWEWNVVTNEVRHNDHWEVITGISNSDNTLKEFVGCILPEDLKPVQRALRDLLDKNRPYSIEFRILRPNGEIIWVWDRGKIAEYDAEGKPLWLVGIILDVTSEKQSQQRITNLAYYDQLTGLLNRAQFEVALTDAIETNARQGIFSALLFLDLDRFKLLNDSYGHHMGDKLLQAVSDRLRNGLEGNAVIARFGGDEFVILLPRLGRDPKAAYDTAQDFANRILKEISRAFTLKSEVQAVEIEYAITASAGGIIFSSGDMTAEKVLQLADTALYRVKSEGGASAVIFDISMHNELAHASELQKSIHKGIENREFTIYIQPKYDAVEKITGGEALVRWIHPVHGVLRPSSFIRMIEENNIILPIGKMVLEQACQQLKQWQSIPATRHLELSINLSAKQIWHNSFVQDFIALVEPYEIDHSKLVVEVTESVLIQDIRDATDKLTRLKAYGFSISLDDFGTGYSSLSYLKSLPIDEIKIDRTFIQDLTRNEQTRIMVKSIIELARNFKMRVISEGVETREQLAMLKQMGVSAFQGYYFSKPLSLDDMDLLLLNGLLAKGKDHGPERPGEKIPDQRLIDQEDGSASERLTKDTA
ncbi:EAL domain-containing protein [uncultured Cohaesibacter sp.]|uniref:sensor domain-containing protein n=1 Tax=uncultured Cohaesibacter sp. TaxID=1002546 RepID=UPI0029C913C0|nr:EAL domain-containing protein [uncultured Cohaesibacter sp.]